MSCRGADRLEDCLLAGRRLWGSRTSAMSVCWRGSGLWSGSPGGGVEVRLSMWHRRLRQAD